MIVASSDGVNVRQDTPPPPDDDDENKFRSDEDDDEEDCRLRCELLLLRR